MVFEAKLLKGGILKRIFEAIKELCTDVVLECSEEGLSLQAMDTSHVALVGMAMTPTLFEMYRCNKHYSLGLSVASVLKALKMCNNDDELTFHHDEGADTIQLIFEAPEANKISQFELKLMQIDQDSLGVPEVDWEATVAMSSKEFGKIVADLKEVSDSIVIEVSKKAIKFSAKGDIGSGHVTLTARPGDDQKGCSIKTTSDEPVALTFAARFLNYFAKGSTLSDKVTVRLSPEQPLFLTFGIENRDNEGTLTFYLAPKIQEEN